MKKIMTYAALIAAGAGLFTACNKDSEQISQQNGDTYAAISVIMNGDNMRDEAAAPSPEDPTKEYNEQGSWNGNDKIETVDIYLVDGTSVSSGMYNVADFTIDGQPGGELKFTPKRAIKTTAGTKKVYVVVNATPSVRQLLSVATASEFSQRWSQAQEAYKENSTAEQALTGIKALAKKDTEGKDVIMMTNVDVKDFNIKENVTAEVALAGTENRASVSVQRVVARVIVTSDKALSMDLHDPRFKGGKEPLGTLSDLTYSVAQGGRQYFLQQTKTDGVIKTPDFDYVSPVVNTMATYYDYADLKNNTSVTKSTGEINNDITAVEPKFILPVTHKQGTKTNPYDGGYFRGNTPYVLVRAKFTPSKDAIVDKGELEDGTFYVGDNGAIYSKSENVTNPEKGGVKDQKYRTYNKGKVLYFAYVNPDNTKRADTKNAPVYRNNVYRINIKKFSALGYNWNPFFPDNNKDFPNPDPNPNEDNPSPLKPSDPLFDNSIYMSVDVTVLKWLVHSYDAELGL